MKKIITISACTTLLALSASSMAITWPWQKKNDPTKTEATHAVENTQKKSSPAETTINLYAEADTNTKVLKKIPVNADLVAIYKKEGWLKVGDRQNGQTGWINIKQYHEAKNNLYRQFFKEKTETVYFHTDTDKDGKVKIVAYKNGKQLSDEDAKKLYQELQKQQEQQWREIEKFNRNMDKMMMNMYDAFPHPILMMPGVVIIDHGKSNTNKPEDNKIKSSPKADNDTKQ